jgi:hypothetical protein
MSKDARRKEKAARKRTEVVKSEVEKEKVEMTKVKKVEVEKEKIPETEVNKVEVEKEKTPVATTKKQPSSGRMTVAQLTEICHTLAEATKECKEDLRDHEDKIANHEDRIAKLEEAVYGPNGVPADEDVNVDVEVEGSEQKTEKKSEQKSEPQPEPAPEPQPEPAPETTQILTTEPDVRPSGFNGVGYAYKFRRSNGRIGITPSKTAADQASGGIFKKIFVEYIDGQINHVLTEEELANAGLFQDA